MPFAQGLSHTRDRSHHLTYRVIQAILGVAIVLLSLAARGHAAAPASAPATGQPKLPIALPTLTVPAKDEDGLARQVVWLDGRRLFAIAVPKVSDAPNTPANPNTARAKVIQTRLEDIVASDFDPATLQTIYKIANQQPVISVNTETSEGQRSTELMTVTTLDAQLNGTIPITWAGELTQIVETALIRAKQERQPSVLQRHGAIAVGIFLSLLLVSSVLHRFQQRLRQERQVLATQAQAILDSTITTQPNPATTQLLQQQSSNRQQQRLNEVKRWVSGLGQLMLWGVGLFVIAGLFPYTRRIQPFTLKWLQIPLRLLAIALGAYLLVRLSEVVIDRILGTLRDSATFAPEASQRVTLRFSTFARVAKSAMVLLLVGTAMILALYTIGVQVAPLLAGAGIIGLAVSFAAQSVIKDMINGFLILLEDQYGVGDVIVIDAVSGLVENMNLRITQLRNEEGRLITIPNSAIIVVQNLSKEWSRVDLTVNVAYQADIDEALSVIDRVAQEMSRDRLWRQLILEPPLLLGIDRLDHTGATVRLWIKTQPLKQWEVAREYRRRLKLAFDEANIPIGVPQQSLWLSSPPELEDEIPASLVQSVSKLTGDPNVSADR